MKTVAVIISGAGADGDNLKELDLPPGSTALEVLSACGLGDGYVLSRDGSAHSFALEEEIYSAVPDGGKLRATPKSVVGAA